MSTMMEISDVGNGGGDDLGLSYQLGEHRICINFSYEEAATAPNVPSALFDMCKVLNQQLDEIQFVDHSKQVIELDTWPTKQTFNDRFSLQFVKARKRHIMVGFILRTNKKFRDIKALIRPILDRHSAWLYPHTLAFTRLDIAPLRYLTHTNPRFHSTACIAEEVWSLLTAQYTQLSGAVCEKFEDDFCDYFNDDNNIDPVELTNSRQWHSTYSAKAFQW
jgi:hypothetical protein